MKLHISINLFAAKLSVRFKIYKPRLEYYFAIKTLKGFGGSLYAVGNELEEHDL